MAMWFAADRAVTAMKSERAHRPIIKFLGAAKIGDAKVDVIDSAEFDCHGG
jgi:hypothetical protein